MNIPSGFVLGAGLGTRLRPLTESWPKPLIPVFQKPLITFAMDHLISSGVTRLAVNTHHAAEAYQTIFPAKTYRNIPIEFRHEDPVLETGGGIGNLRDWFREEPFIVYNGDILSDVPLDRAIHAHYANGHLVTLILRSHGGPTHIAWDSNTGMVKDIRNQLGSGSPSSYMFTGIYIVSPAFLREIPIGEKISVIPIWLRLIQEKQRIGAVVEDGGDWWDLGNREEYVKVHRDLPGTLFPAYPVEPADWNQPVHPSARLAPDAVCRNSVLGAGVEIGAKARVESSILWPGAKVTAEADLQNCIVRQGQSVSGTHRDADF